MPSLGEDMIIDVLQRRGGMKMASLPREKTGLHARMERIEKQNRQLKRYVAVLAVSFFSVAMLGAAAALTDGQFRQITAEKIILVDDAGRERIRLGSGSEGTGLQILTMVSLP